MLFSEYTNSNSSISNYDFITILTWLFLTISELLPFITNIKSNGVLDMIAQTIYNIFKQKIHLSKSECIPNKEEVSNKNSINVSINNIDTITIKLNKSNCQITSN